MNVNLMAKLIGNVLKRPLNHDAIEFCLRSLEQQFGWPFSVLVGHRREANGEPPNPLDDCPSNRIGAALFQCSED